MAACEKKAENVMHCGTLPIPKENGKVKLIVIWEYPWKIAKKDETISKLSNVRGAAGGILNVLLMSAH
jgi:hypothetical protein